MAVFIGISISLAITIVLLLMATRPCAELIAVARFSDALEADQASRHLGDLNINFFVTRRTLQKPTSFRLDADPKLLVYKEDVQKVVQVLSDRGYDKWIIYKKEGV